MQLELSHFGKDELFHELVRLASACRLCPRLQARTKVLSSSNGSIHSKVVFIAEAPGRLGADRTAIPLHGDQAGRNFEELLSRIGWCRSSVFITNAVLCNPRDGNGHNAPPTREELANCSPFLRMTIDLVDPDVVVTLGVAALAALSLIHPHRYELRHHVRELLPWGGKYVFPLYHPSARAAVHRSTGNQIADFYALAKCVDPLEGLRHRKKSKAETVALSALSDIQRAILFFLTRLGPLSWFKLTKLLYMADVEAVAQHGEQLTGELFIRQVDGPWSPSLKKSLEPLNGYEVTLGFRARKPFVYLGPSPRLTPEFTMEEADVLMRICSRHGGKSDASLKTTSYLTAPMKAIRRQEQSGVNMLNSVVLNTPKNAERGEWKLRRTGSE